MVRLVWWAKANSGKMRAAKGPTWLTEFGKKTVHHVHKCNNNPFCTDCQKNKQKWKRSQTDRNVAQINVKPTTERNDRPKAQRNPNSSRNKPGHHTKTEMEIVKILVNWKRPTTWPKTMLLTLWESSRYKYPDHYKPGWNKKLDQF